ncbi:MULTISPECIES: tRNA pseudouridine(38-40) synthase TruA [Helicobacter]|uniref:tRNA pseudouridine synthase A n=2 Tax=Helicobacter ganmani TaxID=60246 RepID=A0A3D8IEW7_9HELI|nr:MULTISPECIES: tRNA pseudouridine(38-40) synthase TruA [Helicobacter]RDU63081.1 tRNA pseudouridine(38-40) synthase TruA [Helicobacter ganmani]
MGFAQDSIKIAMRIAYNGGAFFGFQSQKDVLSVSGTIEAALQSVGIFSNFVGSGRTDKGVHASAQVISLEIPSYWHNLELLKQHLNAKLFPFIKIKQIWIVSEDFNARFSAKRRGYCYVLSKQNSPFLNAFSLPYSIQNVALFKQALEILVGTYDFRAFMKVGGCGDEDINLQCKEYKAKYKEIKGRSVRTIYRTRLLERRHFWILSFWGNGFLRSQIRLMVGFLLEIDKGHLGLEELKAQLMGKKIYRIPVAPNGLFLTRVDYK